MKYINLPLYDDPDYYYTVALEGVAYKIRLYYTLRHEQWVMDVSYADGIPIALGIRLVPMYPILEGYRLPFSGSFLLTPTPDNRNQTVINKYEIWKYYKLHYCYEE